MKTDQEYQQLYEEYVNVLKVLAWLASENENKLEIPLLDVANMGSDNSELVIRLDEVTQMLVIEIVSK